MASTVVLVLLLATSPPLATAADGAAGAPGGAGNFGLGDTGAGRDFGARLRALRTPEQNQRADDEEVFDRQCDILHLHAFHRGQKEREIGRMEAAGAQTRADAIQQHNKMGADFQNFENRWSKPLVGNPTLDGSATLLQALIPALQSASCVAREADTLTGVGAGDRLHTIGPYTGETVWTRIQDLETRGLETAALNVKYRWLRDFGAMKAVVEIEDFDFDEEGGFLGGGSGESACPHKQSRARQAGVPSSRSTSMPLNRASKLSEDPPATPLEPFVTPKLGDDEFGRAFVASPDRGRMEILFEDTDHHDTLTEQDLLAKVQRGSTTGFSHKGFSIGGTMYAHAARSAPGGAGLEMKALSSAAVPAVATAATGGAGAALGALGTAASASSGSTSGGGDSGAGGGAPGWGGVGGHLGFHKNRTNQHAHGTLNEAEQRHQTQNYYTVADRLEKSGRVRLDPDEATSPWTFNPELVSGFVDLYLAWERLGQLSVSGSPDGFSKQSPFLITAGEERAVSKARLLRKDLKKLLKRFGTRFSRTVEVGRYAEQVMKLNGTQAAQGKADSSANADQSTKQWGMHAGLSAGYSDTAHPGGGKMVQSWLSFVVLLVWCGPLRGHDNDV